MKIPHPKGYAVVVDVATGREISSREPIELDATSEEFVIRNSLKITSASGDARLVYCAEHGSQIGWVSISGSVVVDDSVQVPPASSLRFTDD